MSCLDVRVFDEEKDHMHHISGELKLAKTINKLLAMKQENSIDWNM